jgi:hypothetical protein
LKQIFWAKNVSNEAKLQRQQSQKDHAKLKSNNFSFFRNTQLLSFHNCPIGGLCLVFNKNSRDFDLSTWDFVLSEPFALRANIMLSIMWPLAGAEMSYNCLFVLLCAISGFSAVGGHLSTKVAAK